MEQFADWTARWMGILTTGQLVGEHAEQSALRARRLLGGPRLAELRRWFEEQTTDALRDVKGAVVEACIAIVHADRNVAVGERALIERIVELAELDPETARALVARIDTPPALATVAPRIPHPALRELLLVMAWQVARADGKIVPEEHGAFGVLADDLGIPPVRASELRAALRES